MARQFVKLKDVKRGDVLKTDGGFTCMREGVLKKVRQGRDGQLYVRCGRDGRHVLDGQADDRTGRYIGFYWP